MPTEIRRVTVIAATHRCGCLAGHTPEGYLAEAAFCAEALPIERERLALRGAQNGSDPVDGLLPRAYPIKMRRR